jgi:hypothetical protein
MEPVEKRKISELITLYSLEPELKDIYVEGASDKCFINRFLSFKEIDANVIEINDIDFSELYEVKPFLKSDCKKKVIELSCQLESSFSNTIDSIICIVDRDFDEFLNLMVSNHYLNYTDFAAIELYFYNESSVSAFFKDILHDFPLKSKVVLKNLQPVLNNLFNIKLAILKVLGSDFEVNNFEYRKLITIDKKTGHINFDSNEYIFRFLNANNMMPHKNQIEETFRLISQDSSVDFRLKIRGHDFIKLIFYYFDKIKNNIGLTLESFERVTFVCIDLKQVEEFEMFKLLKKKYVCT